MSSVDHFLHVGMIARYLIEFAIAHEDKGATVAAPNGQGVMESSSIPVIATSVVPMTAPCVLAPSTRCSSSLTLIMRPSNAC